MSCCLRGVERSTLLRRILPEFRSNIAVEMCSAMALFKIW